MDLTPDQEAEARRIFELLKDKADAELMAVARLLASKEMGELFGRTEFEVRDRVHRIGAAAVECALAGRKKATVSRVKRKSARVQRSLTSTSDRSG